MCIRDRHRGIPNLLQGELLRRDHLIHLICKGCLLYTSIRPFCGFYDLFLCSLKISIGDIVPDCASEKENILCNNPNIFPQGFPGQLGDCLLYTSVPGLHLLRFNDYS